MLKRGQRHRRVNYRFLSGGKSRRERASLDDEGGSEEGEPTEGLFDGREIARPVTPYARGKNLNTNGYAIGRDIKRNKILFRTTLRAVPSTVSFQSQNPSL